MPLKRPGFNTEPALILGFREKTLGEVAAVNGGWVKNGNCQIKGELLSPPPELQPRIGIASDASNIVISFDSYAQFYTVLWDLPTGISARQRALVLARLPLEIKDGSLPSSSQKYWTDVALDSENYVRLFNLEPKAVKAPYNDMNLKFNRATNKCITSSPDNHKLDKINSMWELPASNKTADNSVYCLYITSSNSEAKETFLGSVYREADDLPLIDKLPLGGSEPYEFRFDDSKSWMAFRTDSSSVAWRVVPWSLNEYRAMARDVFKVEDTAIKVSAATTGKLQGCERGDDDPEFNSQTFNLIMSMSDKLCPSDEVLKGLPHVRLPGSPR